VPFAHVTGAVAGLLEQVHDCHEIRIEPVRHAPACVGIVLREVTMDAIPGGIVSGHEGGATGRANRAAGIKLFKLDAFAGQAVKIRSFQIGVSVATQILPSLIIRKKENDVGASHWPFLFCGGGTPKQDEPCKQ
jgi:hypothetical protein